MLVYDKQAVKQALETADIFDLLQEWGADPQWVEGGIVSATICHNPVGEGSHKLYYYENSGLFRCYTHCGEYFDIMQLYIKIMKLRHDHEADLNEAVRWIAKRFGIEGAEEDDDDTLLEDWKYLANYDRIQELEVAKKNIVLKAYDTTILDRFNYNVKIKPWLDEGISQEVLDHADIGFYPGNDQITIPHFDQNGRFVGLRGRTVVKEDADRFGKYRPMRVNNILYNHPLGMNLYNFNNSKNQIKAFEKAIVFEGEKSDLLYQSYFGIDNDISVACCGSSLSAYQVQLLVEAGAKEIIVAFDRQFKQIGDDEFKHLKTNLIKLNNKYSPIVKMSFIFDKNMITSYKDSPIDKGKDIFLKLFKERIIL